MKSGKDINEAAAIVVLLCMGKLDLSEVLGCVVIHEEPDRDVQIANSHCGWSRVEKG